MLERWIFQLSLKDHSEWTFWKMEKRAERNLKCPKDPLCGHATNAKNKLFISAPVFLVLGMCAE